MISTLGDVDGNAKGNFFLLDGKNDFELKELWNKGDEDIMGHDFWYQPRHNIMVSSEFGAPNKLFKGFTLDDVKHGM